MLKYPATRIRMSEKVNYSKYTNSASDRIHHIKLVGVVEEEVTLNELKKQAGDVSKFETLVCEIASPGGSVSEGLMIMVWLDQLSMMGKQIITVVSANAYSIASLIMLAADIKVISRHGKVMVHNPMIPELKYANANELEKYATELRDLESVMYELYQVFTGLDQGQIKALMDKETYLTPQEAVDNGFADVIVDIKQRSYEMTANNKKEINMSKTLNILNRVIGMVNKADYINQLYYDETGVEIEIFQNDPSTYSVGDRTDMAEGSVKLSDGSVLTIEGSIITEIGKAVETPIEAPIEAPMDAEFNEGPAPEKINAEHEEPMIHAPGEEMPMAEPAKQKGDMPATVIETTESVKTTKETVAQAEAKMDDDKQMKMGDDKEMKMDEDGAEMKMEPKAVAPMDDDLKMLLGSMQKNMVALGEQIAALSEGQAKYDSKFKQIQNFEEIASEAIDALASSTVSNFKPAAKAVVEPVQTGSIFQKLKNSRGL
jgi:ATP-dependent protease ClpP protease subunit